MFTKFKINKKNNFFIINGVFNEQDIKIYEVFYKLSTPSRFNVKIGKYYRDYSTYYNDELGIGHILISNNAEAIPKIGITSSKIINSKIKLDYGISHGVIDDSSYLKFPFLHEKFLYLNFKKENIIFSIGLAHAAIWGGKTLLDGSQPDSFKDFLKVFISADGPVDPKKTYPGHKANALGNHLGIWDIFLETKKNSSVYKFYYQHLFEDTSGLRFANQIDGLWGFEVYNDINKFKFLVELLHTTHQNLNPPYVQESYYNHGIYSNGWSYKNYTLGNSYINHLNAEPINSINISFDKKSFLDYRLRFVRRIDKSAKINYQLVVSKKYENIFISVSLMNDMMKNEKQYNFGIGLVL